MDLLARQIGSVVEILENGRLRQQAACTHRVAVTEGMPAGGLHAHAARYRLRLAVEPHGRRFNIHALAALLPDRITDHITIHLHRPLGGVLPLVGVVVGEIGWLQAGERRMRSQA